MPDTRAGLHILVVAPGRQPAGAVEGAMARLCDEQRIPHEIHVVAPRERMAELQRECLGGGAARFAAACTAAGFPRDEILFNQRTLHVLDDHASGAANADRVLALLRQLASSDDVALTVVVCEDAGAAGCFLHAALHIMGRLQDRLLLDTVMPVVRRKGANAAASRQGGRHLELPVLLWPANEPVPQTYAEAVKRRRIERLRITTPDVLRLDVRRRILSVGETSVTLPAMQFFWLYYLASTAGERLPLTELTGVLGGGARRHPAQLTQRLAGGGVRVFPADLQRAFVQLFPMAADKFDAMYVRSCGPHPGLPSTISKINAALRRALGRGAEPYLIQGGRGAGGYRLPLPASGIQIAGVDPRRA